MVGGQTTNVANLSLVVRTDSDIATVADLREKIVASGSLKDLHPNLNEWLYLKQNGLDADKDEVEIRARKPDQNKSARDMILDGEADAALMTPPNTQIAKSAGLKVIDIAPLPMILNTTVSTSQLGLPSSSSRSAANATTVAKARDHIAAVNTRQKVL